LYIKGVLSMITNKTSLLLVTLLLGCSAVAFAEPEPWQKDEFHKSGLNNAGVAGQALFQDITPELWHRYFSVNVDGAFHTIQAVLPHMLHQHTGCIVNISSIWGQRGASCEVTYSCTKAALIGLTRSLAMELAPTHIRVNCVAPGVIRTDMLDALPPEVLPQLAQETPLGRLGTPEDIAHAVAFLAGEQASFITGQVLTCDGGFIL